MLWLRPARAAVAGDLNSAGQAVPRRAARQTVGPKGTSRSNDAQTARRPWAEWVRGRQPAPLGHWAPIGQIGFGSTPRTAGPNSRRPPVRLGTLCRQSIGCPGLSAHSNSYKDRDHYRLSPEKRTQTAPGHQTEEGSLREPSWNWTIWT